MATLISYADGNLTGATTFKGVETGSGAIQATISASTAATTSYVYGTAFTCTNLDVIEGVLIHVDGTGTTGSFYVALSDDNGVTATRELQVNTADLPQDPSWVFFKFGSTLTADGGSDYKVGVKISSGASAPNVYRDGTAGNWAHILRLNGAATPTTADAMYIVGELTGAGTGTDFTVTMDSTTTTDYGAIDIGKRGTLTYGTAATTNYMLKMSGDLKVWDDGTLSIGTTGTPIPRGSTASLNFDCSTNVEFGLTVQNGGTFNAQGLSRTSGKNIYYCKLNTDEAVNSTSLGVDTDTGWLDNDEIAVASTTRTASQCEKGTLNGDAGASSITVDGFGGAGGGLAYAHDGTSPVQAEVILLTRNVKIYGASASLQAYVDFKETATVDIDWVEIYWLGSNTVLKRGISWNTTTGSSSIQYSSLHNFEVANSIGIHTTNAALSNSTFSNNVFYLIANIHLSIATTSGTWTADSNIFMRNTDSANLVTLSDVGGTFTNNTMVGGASAGLVLSEGATAAGTISNNTVHSCTSTGINISSQRGGTFSDFLSWRNNAAGLSFATGCIDVTIDGAILFGNSTNNISNSGYDITLIDIVCSGDSTFATGIGIALGAAAASPGIVKIINSTFGAASGIYVSHSSSDFSVGNNQSGTIIFRNVLLASSTESASLTACLTNFSVGSQKHDQTAGNHKTWKKYGTITIDTTAGLYRTASPSERLTPNNASGKLESGIKKVAVANGATLTPSVYVRESVVGDGTDYNGNFARLILKRNDAIGITSDTVIDTATASSAGAFEQLTGTTAAATDDGVMEFCVDCDGTTGWINIDDWSVA